ncbi:NACHT domain-containing protein [Desulfobulbus sp. TB]|nr:NACHT domain-containing protein [Desulfobulbus sp. TB]
MFEIIYNIFATIGSFASIASAVIVVKDPAIRKRLKDYVAYISAYIKTIIYTEDKLFASYTALIIRSILKQDSSLFIDIPVDIKKSLIDLSNDKDSATILTVIDKYDKCVVLGLGGRGKSTLVKELERRYADEYHKKGYLPFSLSPEDIWSEGLIETIKLRCEENGVHIPSITFEKYSTHQPFLLLIDGVEILSKEERKILSQDLKGYIHRVKYPPKVVLTVAHERSDNVLKDMEITKDMNIVELLEFEDRHIDEYVRNQRGDESDKEKRIAVIRGCGKVAKLTRTPLLLNMLLGLPEDRRKECYHSWANFIETVIDPKLDERYEENGIKITYGYKEMALQKIAEAFYQHGKEPPATIKESAVNAAIQETFQEYHENEAYQKKTLRNALTKKSNFLVAFDNGAHYAFVNKYFQKYFVAQYFLDRKKELLDNYQKHPVPYSGVLRLWVGLSDSPDSLITDVSEIDPFLCLTLLADVQSPPKGLLESTLESVKNKIDSFSLPDAHADSKQIDKYFSNLHQLCEWLADSTKGENSGEKILDSLIDMTIPIPDSLSTRFVISVMALARSYNPRAARRIMEISNELDCKINRLHSDEKRFRDMLHNNTLAGEGCKIVYYTSIKSGRLPGCNLLDLQRAWIKVNELTGEKAIYKFIKTWIRIEFGTLGEIGVDVLIDNLKNCERDEDKEGYLRMLEDIGTDRALKEVERIE